MLPRGTTKVVELTLIERKRLAKKALAAHVARIFAKEPTRITIKSFGRYDTIANIGWGFQINSRNRRFSPEKAEGFKHFQEFVDHLDKHYRPTELLRMAKLIRQRENDTRSLKGKKKSDLRIVSFDW
jgi:hypothetical protein